MTMNLNNRKEPLIRFILGFYLVCFALHVVESLAVRTDETIAGELFIHKLAGIVLLGLVLRLIKLNWADIGFAAKQFWRDLVIGGLFGIFIYAIAYIVECIVNAASGNAPTLSFYATSYNVLGNQPMQSGLLYVLICVAGNIINAVMEECVFRGLFLKLAAKRTSFIKAAILSSVLFGVWHITGPLRNFLDGSQSVGEAVVISAMLVGTSFLFGFLLCLLVRVTGSLWAGMAVHFINNASVNLLHTVTATGVDEYQTMRISIALSIAFVAVMVVYIYKKRKDAFKSNGGLT